MGAIVAKNKNVCRFQRLIVHAIVVVVVDDIKRLAWTMNVNVLYNTMQYVVYIVI